MSACRAKRTIFFFLGYIIWLPNSLVFSYPDQNSVLEAFSKIDDITNPCLEEYQRLQEFLLNGNREYLWGIGTKPNKRNCRALKLIGENNEMPIREVFYINTSGMDRDRCIVLYSSYNYPYPEKMNLLVQQLKDSGYKGHIISRIGSYPNLEFGGLLMSHIPYSWKLACLLEGRNLGYRYVVWLDAAMHPQTNLEEVFSIIKKSGYLFISSGFNLDYPYSLKQHTEAGIAANRLAPHQLCNIPHVSSQIIAVDTYIQITNDFLDEWEEETLKVLPNVNWYPEELCLSAVAWRNNLPPVCRFDYLVETRQSFNVHHRVNKPFYWDDFRENDKNWDSSLKGVAPIKKPAS